MADENPDTIPSTEGEHLEDHEVNEEGNPEQHYEDIIKEEAQAEGEEIDVIEHVADIEVAKEVGMSDNDESTHIVEMEAEIEELEEEREISRSEGSEDLGRPMFATMIFRDFTIEDPSFLDEFDSTVVELVEKEEEAEEVGEEAHVEEESVSDEDRYAVYDIPSPPTTDIYGQICERLTIMSTDSIVSDVPSRIEKEVDVWKCPSGMRGNEMAYLKTTARPGLVRALAEVALYQPARPVEYLAHCLDRSRKSREELGMDPDPRAIQALVDAHERALEAARRRRRSTVPSAESSPSSQASSRLQQRADQEKHRASAAIRAARIKKGGLQYKTSQCLGPTTLVKGYLPTQRRPTN